MHESKVETGLTLINVKLMTRAGLKRQLSWLSCGNNNSDDLSHGQSAMSRVKSKAESKGKKPKRGIHFANQTSQMAPKPITSPVPDAWYPTLSVFMLAIGLFVTASFFM
ncbi:hypothetical protein WN943_001208 [Citrus x changshan-huyou]